MHAVKYLDLLDCDRSIFPADAKRDKPRPLTLNKQMKLANEKLGTSGSCKFASPRKLYVVRIIEAEIAHMGKNGRPGPISEPPGLSRRYARRGQAPPLAIQL